MAKTSYQLIPPELDLSYKKALQSSERFIFPRVRRKTLFISRNRKKGITQKSLIPVLSPVWQALTEGEREAWNSAGAIANMTGFRLFIRDKSLRIANDIEGFATPNNLYQTTVGTLIVNAPATSLKIQQLHPEKYWVSKKVKGTRNQYEPRQVIEDFQIPLQIKINYKANLVNAGIVYGDSVLVDSYIESNKNNIYAFWDGTGKVGQSFTATAQNLSSCKFYLKKVGNPTGVCVAKLYSLTGTYGINSKPLGTALAISDSFSISDIPSSFSLVTFTFSGLNKYEMIAGNKYGIALEMPEGDESNNIEIGVDSSLPAHSGNFFFEQSSSGYDIATNTYDCIFYVYGQTIISNNPPKARFYCIVYSHYQGLNFENICEIPFTLQQDWTTAEATITSVIGKDRGYTAFIEIENAQGTLYFDNIEINHSGQNWARDPHTIDIDQSFTKAFYQIPKHWAPVDIPDSAFYGSLYYNE